MGVCAGGVAVAPVWPRPAGTAVWGRGQWVHRGTGVTLSTSPWSHGGCWHWVPSPGASRAGTGDIGRPDDCHRAAVGTRHRSSEHTVPPRMAGREEHVPPRDPRGQWGPSLRVSHGCRAAVAPTQEPPRASWRWEMAPCHHGNGATSSPCQGDTPSRGARRSEQQRAPRGHRRGTRHPPWRPALTGARCHGMSPVGCHPGRAQRSRRFPEQPPADAHRQGYNLAKSAQQGLWPAPAN